MPPSMPLGLAVFLLVSGLLLGSIFTFGMSYWNSVVTREACTLVETQFVSYDEIWRPKRPMEIKEIAIDCVNGKRYFIDGVSVSPELRNALRGLCNQESITLLIHPNSNTVVELSSEDGFLMIFNDTIKKLKNEAIVFLLLGIFMFFCSFVGLCYTVLDIILKRQTRRSP